MDFMSGGEGDRVVFDNTEDVQVIILGGGQGQRLYPLTAGRSKPAVPFGGKYRLIDIPMSNCINSNLTQIYVLTQFNSASLNQHVVQAYQFGTITRGFVEVLAAQQTMENTDWYQGTADAVRQNLTAMADHKCRYVLILAGDHLYRMDYRPFLRAHVDRNADISIAVNPAKEKDASEFGIMRVGEGAKIIEFHEKPKDKDVLKSLAITDEKGRKRFMASMGVYIFNWDVLLETLSGDATDFGKHVIPDSISRYNVVAFKFDDYWRDIGTIRSFYEANIEMVAPIPPFNFYDSKYPIYTLAPLLPASKINYSSVEWCLLSDGCIVNRAELRNSVIGVRAFIRAGARIVDSVILGADYYENELQRSDDEVGLGIGEGVEIHKAIIDKNARIGDKVKILNKKGVKHFDGPNYVIRDGIVIVPKNTVIPPGTVI